MKKLIAVLAIMVVLAGAVFAAETHRITIKGDVTVVVPVFGLNLGTYTTNAATLTTVNTVAPYTTQYGAATTYGMTALDETDAIAVTFKLDKGGSVTFNAVLLNPAKQNASYTLEFGDGVFNVSRNGITENQKLAPKSITTEAKGAGTGVSTALGDAVGQSTTNKKIAVTFNGTTVDETLPYTLATAVYAYDADPTIDPTTNGAFYYADVTMAVTAP